MTRALIGDGDTTLSGSEHHRGKESVTSTGSPLVDVEAEVDRLVDRLTLSSRYHERAGRKSSDVAKTCGARQIISADAVYDRALTLLDEEGAQSLTVRRLAADLSISTRTLYKRIRSRDNMIRHVVALFLARLNLEPRQTGSWESTALGWCVELHRTLVAHPHLTRLLTDRVSVGLHTHAENLVQLAVQDGIPLGDAAECCRSLVNATISEAFAVVHALPDHPDADSGDGLRALERDFANTITFIVKGVRAGAPGLKTVAVPEPPMDHHVKPNRHRNGNGGMNRAQEVALAWALVDVARPFLDKGSRTWLCAKIGAGEHECAIKDLLDEFVRNMAGLPDDLVATVRVWISGYSGSDRESVLGELIDRISESVADQPSDRARERGRLRIDTVAPMARRARIPGPGLR